MKKPLTPLASALIAGAAILVVVIGGLLYLNRPSGGLTDEEVKKYQWKPGAHPAVVAPAATTATASGVAPAGPSSSDFPPGGPGGATGTNP